MRHCSEVLKNPILLTRDRGEKKKKKNYDTILLISQNKIHRLILFFYDFDRGILNLYNDSLDIF